MTELGAWSLVEAYLPDLMIDGEPEEFLASFSRLPTSVQHLCAAHLLVTEVEMGGFSQLLYNSVGVLAPEAARGLRAMDMPGTAAIVEELLGWFGDQYPRDRNQRWEMQQAFEAAHGSGHGDDCPVCSIDQRFYRLIEQELGGFYIAADAYAAKARQ